MLLPLKPIDQIDYKGNLDFSIVIRNRKIVGKLWTVLLIFLLELEISEMVIQKIHQNIEKLELLGWIVSESDFETVSSIFC